MKRAIALLSIAVAIGIHAQQPGEIEDYLLRTLKAYDVCIGALEKAADARETAEALKQYAGEMKIVIGISKEIDKRNPGFQNSKAFQEEMTKRKAMDRFLRLMQLLTEARKKYHEDASYQEAEKALVEAGLFGKGKE